MNRPKCANKKCENLAIVLYGTNWICGDCYMKIHNKNLEKKNKELEDLENDN